MISSHTLVVLAGLLVAVGGDQGIGEFDLGVSDITKGCGDAVIAAEGFPLFEDGVLGALMLGSGAGGCELERSAEISL